MLDALRKSTGSLVAKILFALLILSFGIWGIGDVVNSRANSRPAVTVGDVEISGSMLREQFTRQMERFREIFGPGFDTESARQMGLVESTISALSASAAQEMLARDLGIVVSDEGLRDITKQQPAFQKPDGSFDRARFTQILAANNLTENAWLDMARKDLVRARIEGALTTGIDAPLVLAESVYRFREERRDATMLSVSAEAMTVEGMPDESALKNIYEENRAAFSVPETRALSVMILRPDMLEKSIMITDSDIEADYTENKSLYTSGESRHVTQVIVETEDIAQRIFSSVQAGDSLSAASLKSGTGNPLDMGNITKDSLPGETASLVWDLPSNGVSRPVQSAVGWHIFSAGPVVPAATKPLATVKEEIQDRLRREKASEDFYNVARHVEDALAAGTSYNDIATKFGIDRVDIAAVTADGSTPDGQMATLPVDMMDDILKEAFVLQQGEESRFKQTDSGAFSVRINTIQTATTLPLETVRHDAEKLWREDARRKAAVALAEQLDAKLTAGKDPENLIDKAQGISLVTLSGITRDGRTAHADSGTAPRITQKLFALTKGKSAVVGDDQGAHVLLLTEINPPDPSKDSHGLSAIRDNIRTALINDVNRAVTDALINRYGMQINQTVIDSALP